MLTKVLAGTSEPGPLLVERSQNVWRTILSCGQCVENDPVLRAWLAWQEATGLHTGPAFRPVHPRARLDSPDVLALRAAIQAGPRLGAHCIDRLLKRAAQRAGLPDWQRYGIHSQRRGAAIELRRQGASDFEIAQAGGWRLDQVRRFAKTARIPDIWDDPEAGRLGL